MEDFKEIDKDKLYVGVDLADGESKTVIYKQEKRMMNAEQYINKNVIIWCDNKQEWEKDNLRFVPNDNGGHFIDVNNKPSRHRIETHPCYVNREHAIEALKIQKKEFREYLEHLLFRMNEGEQIDLNEEEYFNK